MTPKIRHAPSDLGICMMAQGWAAPDLDREIARIREAKPAARISQQVSAPLRLRLARFAIRPARSLHPIGA